MILYHDICFGKAWEITLDNPNDFHHIRLHGNGTCDTVSKFNFKLSINIPKHVRKHFVRNVKY